MEGTFVHVQCETLKQLLIGVWVKISSPATPLGSLLVTPPHDPTLFLTPHHIFYHLKKCFLNGMNCLSLGSQA